MRVTLVRPARKTRNLQHQSTIRRRATPAACCCDIEAGETFEYQFDLPRDHAPGLNWYHPHPHGHGTHQMFGGMAGAVIFRSARRAPRGGSPPMRDRVLVLQAPEWDAGGGAEAVVRRRCSPPSCGWSTDSCDPRIPIRDGRDPALAHPQRLRQRLLRSPARRAPADCRSPPTAIRSSAPVELDIVHIPPGGRAEVLVEGGAPGSYALRALPFDHGAGFVVARARPRHARVLTALAGPQARAAAPPARAVLRPPRAARRPTTAGSRCHDDAAASRSTASPSIRDRVDQVVELDTVEEWTIVNDSPLVHPFHIHVNPVPAHARQRRARWTSRATGTPSRSAALGGSITFRTVLRGLPGQVACSTATSSRTPISA